MDRFVRGFGEGIRFSAAAKRARSPSMVGEPCIQPSGQRLDRCWMASRKRKCDAANGCLSTRWFSKSAIAPSEVPTADRRSLLPHTWDERTQIDCSVRFDWEPIGRICLDENGKLQFPNVSEAPGLYKLRIRIGTGEAVYIGETDNLRRRFANYHNPGPTQPTNVRINRRLLDALITEAEISVAIVSSSTSVKIGDKTITVDLASKPFRLLFENAALIASQAHAIESLNL